MTLSPKILRFNPLKTRNPLTDTLTNSEDTDEDTDEEKITKTDQENANTLADLFTSVFTIEPDSELPDLDTKDVPKLNIF